MSKHETLLLAAPDEHGTWFDPFATGAHELWLVNHLGSTVLRCMIVESRPERLRVRVPIGYGVNTGQNYELCACRPGDRLSETPGAARRWVAVTFVEPMSEDDGDYLDASVEFVPEPECLSAF